VYVIILLISVFPQTTCSMIYTQFSAQGLPNTYWWKGGRKKMEGRERGESRKGKMREENEG
jgi:hypothetical protein